MSSALEKAYDFIKSAIMTGTYQAGDRIKEEWVAEQIGVSRTPIRNAMQKLAAQGFVVVSHHQGGRVANWSSEDLREITELRALLESFGAGIAARKISQDELGALRDLASGMEACARNPTAEDFARITDLNSQFHMAIVEASGNRRLAEVIGNLAHPLLVQRKFSTFDEARLARSMAHHRELIDALAAGKGDWASAIMRAHILASSNADE
ncbi:GntR family transcriptional regulator [Maritimibacter dapengensis]|uniref:GntR family transcriptional regulator n=1 Tax=Maritimibacter dapengensis TaxID=2836868 RepID=A0ABS6SXB5_9RHOB|nr:GntR family transcriptional regulator [Maritimibacter dapengensis]MBV7377604.1 GntR family transcriptional regulator [Maritimibacter dapengensis]